MKQLHYAFSTILSLSLAAIFSVRSASAVEPATENLIANGDLEQTASILSNGLPSGMTYWSNNKDHPVAKTYLSQEEKTSGEHSLCIERLDDPRDNSRVSLAPVRVDPGSRYYFSCNVKNTERAVRIIFKPKSGKGNDAWLGDGLSDVETPTQGATIRNEQIVILNLDKNLSADPDGFNKLELNFTTPPDCVFLSIVLDFSWNAHGKAWFDDFELMALD